MEKLFKEFKEYLKNASDEELRKNYEELKWCDEIGPTLEEYAQQLDDSRMTNKKLEQI